MTDNDGKTLVRLLADMEEDEALALARRMLGEGFSAMRMPGLCREAMDIVGGRYEAQEYFLTELMLAGETMKACMAVLSEKIGAGGAIETKGKVVLCAVSGDVHDIGKNLDRKSTRLNSSHSQQSRMPSSA